MKYIVTSGCSFTRQYRRVGITGTAEDFMEDSVSQWKWPHFIQSEYPDYKVYNYGNPTNDNAVIAKSILYGVNDLIKKGISTSDIKVIVQWSGWSRNSAFISKQKQIENDYFLNKEFVKERDKDRYPINEDFAHINDFINEPKNYIGEHGYFVLSGGYHNGHVKTKSKEYFEDYVDHIFSADERMIEYMQNILLIQYFCKANDIDYKCFTMHNNFSKDYVNEDYKVWFPNSFDDTLISPRDIGKKCDVGFCGSLLNRNEYINLLSSNFKFIYDNFVIGDKMVESINSYKVHWNRNLSNDINYRNFETIGCGIPLVTNYNYQYEELGFIDGVNVMMYKDNNEMILKINQLLTDDNLRESIGKSGLELSKQHTYEKRCEFLINLYSDIKNGL